MHVKYILGTDAMQESRSHRFFIHDDRKLQNVLFIVTQDNIVWQKSRRKGGIRNRRRLQVWEMKGIRDRYGKIIFQAWRYGEF